MSSGALVGSGVKVVVCDVEGCRHAYIGSRMASWTMQLTDGDGMWHSADVCPPCQRKHELERGQQVPGLREGALRP